MSTARRSNSTCSTRASSSRCSGRRGCPSTARSVSTRGTSATASTCAARSASTASTSAMTRARSTRTSGSPRARAARAEGRQGTRPTRTRTHRPTAPDPPVTSDDPASPSGATPIPTPRFVSEAYFMDFKFEPGNYYLAGREQLDGQQVLRIEYYPTRMFNDRRGRQEQKDRRTAGTEESSGDRERKRESAIAKRETASVRRNSGSSAR